MSNGFAIQAATMAMLGSIPDPEQFFQADEAEEEEAEADEAGSESAGSESDV